MNDRERTVFAAAEAAFGAVFVLIGLLVALRTGSFGQIVGFAVLVLGSGAVLQSVLVGLGLVTIYERRGSERDDD